MEPLVAQLLTKALTGSAPSVNFHLQELNAPLSNEVLVRFLACPINPLDVLVLRNSYPVKPTHQHLREDIVGYDGLAEVVTCGADVLSLQPGDLVVPSRFGVGTWRTHAILNSHSLQKINRPHDLAFGSILKITVAPAFCLVEDMRTLRAGDCIIQNAATSVIAQMVILFARRRGVKVISVVRDRDSVALAEVKNILHKLGAHLVLSESELPKDPRIAQNRITLALDSVFGESGRALVKSLSAGGTYVQLGLLGGPLAPLSLDASDLFGRQINMKGFRGSAQLGARSFEEQSDLFNWFVALFNAGELKLPPLGIQKVDWLLGGKDESRLQLQQAVSRAQGDEIGQRKQIIIFRD